MAMTRHEKMTLHISALCLHNTAANARFFAHPFDEHGLLDPQPSAEQSAKDERDAQGMEDYAAFYESLIADDDALPDAVQLPPI